MRYLKPLLLTTVFLAIIWVLYQPGTRAYLLQAASWAESNQVLAAPLFVGFLIVAVVMMFPIWGMLMIGGYIFGFLFGFMLAWVGLQVGSYLAFIFARTIGRNWVKSRFSANPKFRSFEKSIDRNGFKAILLARASVIVPTNLINLLSGISSLGSKNFIGATALGSIPLIGLYTFLGAQSSNLIDSISNGTFKAPEISPTLIGLAAIFAVVLAAYFYFKPHKKHM